MSAKQSSRAKQKASTCLKIYIQLPFVSSRLELKGNTGQTKIRSLKSKLDREFGLLPEMYHLSYLDAAPLEDNTSLSSHDVISGATLTLRPWSSWEDLLKAAYLGNIVDCFECSVNIAGSSPWSKYCAWTALYIASHQGHHTLVARLLERTQLAINMTSPYGKTALHAAAGAGHWKTMCVLLDNGADVRIKNEEGQTAFDLSRKHGHKNCEDSLNFCQWNLQKHHITKERKFDYDASNARQKAMREAHMHADSSLSPGLRGTQGQIYLVHTINPVSVQKVQSFEKEKSLRPSTTLPAIVVQEENHEEEETDKTGEKFDFDYGWFDPLRAQQLIPSTDDVLTYSDPSSCHLRPKSIVNPGGYASKPGTAKRGRGS